jgi:quercetin dioxygenase-like cupin family protein
MIVIKKDEVQPLDVGEILNNPVMKGVTIQWLIHKGIGDERYGHDFAMRSYKIPPGKMFPMHFHKYVEAVYVLSGRMEFEDEENAYKVGPGDVIYTYSDEPHGMTVLGDEPVEVVCCINCLGDKANCDPQKQAQIIKTK